MATERDQVIRERAYQLWVEGGRQPGTDEQDWLAAEREQASKLAAKGETTTAKAPAKAAVTAKAASTTKSALKTTAAEKVAAGPAKARTRKPRGTASSGAEPGR